MSKGVILFAYNNKNVDYYKMAVATAKRVNHFLNLPVTVVTDETTDIESYGYTFDKTIINEADKSNIKENTAWINKGRFNAYEFSPYDETIVLDTDYMINSDTLLKTFDFESDLMCHNRTSVMMAPDAAQEPLSTYSVNTLWATVIRFNKSLYAKQVFESMKMIQNNYTHYMHLYRLNSDMYRNDYSLTIATRICNGHTEDTSQYLPWNLTHVGQNTTVYKVNDSEFNTEYMIMYDNWIRDKLRKEYITIKDFDFHMLNKKNFMELI